MRRAIVNLLDPLSARFLGATSKSNWELTRQSRQRERCFEAVLFGYGTRRLLTKYFPARAHSLDQHKGERALMRAARTGNSAAITWILHRIATVPTYIWTRVLFHALRHARFNIIQRCTKWQGGDLYLDNLYSDHVQAIVESGRGIELLQFLEQKTRYKVDMNLIVNTATLANETDLLNWAYMKMACDGVSVWWRYPLPSKQLATLQWCYERSWRPVERTFRSVCAECTPDVLDWLQTIGYPCECDVWVALWYDRLDNAKWLYNHGRPVSLERLELTGSLTTEMVTWLANDVVLTEQEKDILFKKVNQSCDITHMQILRSAGYTWRQDTYEQLWGMTSQRAYDYWLWLQGEGCLMYEL
jgi:hypothetical protein